ncbi:hypothetical protein CBR_g38506 [Chara braunii]|uniref:Uncharacterized protein n=1 Tax=Chara braunii TaxID=69332 RepID=A0A388JP48_CHABU|nr:hypothetical protein CBR_g38506 [Chara braunii]|eukprot:GBG59482.1 hypothetical protein CBR_g38506 [Chara braunii]
MERRRRIWTRRTTRIKRMTMRSRDGGGEEMDGGKRGRAGGGGRVGGGGDMDGEEGEDTRKVRRREGMGDEEVRGAGGDEEDEEGQEDEQEEENEPEETKRRREETWRMRKGRRSEGSGVAVEEELEGGKSLTSTCGAGLEIMSHSMSNSGSGGLDVQVPPGTGTGTSSGRGTRAGTGTDGENGVGPGFEPGSLPESETGLGTRLNMGPGIAMGKDSESGIATGACAMVDYPDGGSLDLRSSPDSAVAEPGAGFEIEARVESAPRIDTGTRVEHTSGTKNEFGTKHRTGIRTESRTGNEPAGGGISVGMCRGTGTGTSRVSGDGAENRMRTDHGGVLRRSNRKITHSAIVREIVQDQLQFGCLLNKRDCPGLPESSFCELVDAALGTIRVPASNQPHIQRLKGLGKGESSRRKTKADGTGCAEKKMERQKKEATKEKDSLKAKDMDMPNVTRDGAGAAGAVTSAAPAAPAAPVAPAAEPCAMVPCFAGHSTAARLQKVRKRAGKLRAHSFAPSSGATDPSITDKSQPLATDSQENSDMRLCGVERCQQQPVAERSDFGVSDHRTCDLDDRENGSEIKETRGSREKQSMEGSPSTAVDLFSNQTSAAGEQQGKTIPPEGLEAREAGKGDFRVSCGLFEEGKENVRWDSSEAKGKGALDAQPVFRIREICRMFGGGEVGGLFRGRAEKRLFDGSFKGGGKESVRCEEGTDGRTAREHALDADDACPLNHAELRPPNDFCPMQGHVLRAMGTDIMADVPIEIGGLCRRVPSRGRVMRSVLMC